MHQVAPHMEEILIFLCEKDGVDHPVSIYVANEKSNELMAHSYSHLFSLPTTGLRFFTVYGPWVGQIWHYFFSQKLCLKVKNKCF